MSLFPIFVKLEGRPVLLVGAGPVGESKVGGLLSAGAVVTVVAPDGDARRFGSSPRTASLCWHQREFDPDDLDGVTLVVAAVPRDVARADLRGSADPQRARQLGRRSRQLRFLLSGGRQSRRPADRDLHRGTQPRARAAHSHRARAAVRPRNTRHGFSSSARRGASCLRRTWIRSVRKQKLHEMAARMSEAAAETGPRTAYDRHGVSRWRGPGRSGAADAEGAARFSDRPTSCCTTIC